MRRSLQRRLSTALAGAILSAGLAASIVSFHFSYTEAQEFQDEMLRQVAALALSSPTGVIEQVGDEDSRILVVRPDQERPAWLPGDLKPGFHTLNAADDSMRVYVRHASDGREVAIAQDTDLRDEIALHSALRTLLPTLVLIPLLLWLGRTIVRRVFRPVRELARTVDSQTAEMPQPLPHEEVPEEIAAFVHAINRMLERIKRLMDEQRRFVADAAHELRSPLTALSVQVRNVENASSMPAMRERLVAVNSGLERARHLTEQLLNLARSQAGNSERTQVDLAALTRELIAENWSDASARGIDLGMEELAQPKVSAAPETLRMILRNALDNALRYTPPDGQVTIRLSEEGEDAIVDIIDSGTGIPPADRDRAFSPFFRMPGSASDGSGLGLAIARDAATRLGGVVSLEDGPAGVGLVFRYRQARVH